MNKYARAAGGNWSADATWSTTSGGAADTVKPTAGDDVFLDANSGPVTLDGTPACRSINCTGYTNTLTHNASVSFAVGDGTAGASNIALKFVAGMTYTLGNATSSAVYFITTSATTQTIDFAGKTTGNVVFNATSNGSWQYTGQHVTGTTTTVTLTKGTLDINGQTCSWGLFDSSNNNTRSLTLGAADITITGGAYAAGWNMYSVGSLTLSAATSTLRFTNYGAIISCSSASSLGSIICTNDEPILNTAIKCVNLSVTGVAAKTGKLQLVDNATVSGTFTCNGNSSVNRVLVYSNTRGTARTINAATVSCSNTDFQDITGAGAGSWDFSARTDIGNCGGNTNITFPASVPQYYGGVNLNGSYLRCNGIASNYVSAPSSSANITGDMTIDVKCSMDDWTPSAQKTLIGKYEATGNQRGFVLNLNTDGTLGFVSTVDGTLTGAVSVTSSAATGVSDLAIKWIRVTHDVDNGASGNDVKFYTSDDGSSWSQLGTTQTTAGVHTRFNSTNVLEVGSQKTGTSLNCSGNFYRARIYSDITQSTLTFDANFAVITAGSKSFAESSANAATVSLVVTGGNWSASSWTTRVPLPQDDVYLGNAFAASQTVTADMPRLGRSIDWTGATGSPTFANTTADTLYGSITFISAMTLGSSAGMTFGGRGSYTITTNGKTIPWGTTIAAPNGTYTLSNAYISTSGSAFTLTAGTFNTAGFSVTYNSFSSNNSNTRTLTMTNSIWTITSTSAATVWDASGSNLTVNALGSEIIIANATTNGRNFSTNAKTWGTLTYTVAGSTGQLKIQGGSASFNKINFSDANNARTLVIDQGQTITIRSENGFNVRGTSGKLMTVNSGIAATHTLSSTYRQSCNYLNLSYSVAQGGGAWYAGANSTNSGNNSGWIFTDPPALIGKFSRGIRHLGNLANLARL